MIVALVPFTVFLTSKNAPVDYIAKISPRPLLLIHGTLDEIVPYSMSEKLFNAAKEPKRLWTIDGAGHLQCRALAGKQYHDETIGEFFTEAIRGNAKS